MKYLRICFCSFLTDAIVAQNSRNVKRFFGFFYRKFGNFRGKRERPDLGSYPKPGLFGAAHRKTGRCPTQPALRAAPHQEKLLERSFSWNSSRTLIKPAKYSAGESVTKNFRACFDFCTYIRKIYGIFTHTPTISAILVSSTYIKENTQ